MDGEITAKLQEILHKYQTWVDNEKYIPKKFRTKSWSDEFAEKIIRELEAEMIKQKFSPHNDKIYLPTKYLVEINQADSLEFTGLKREVLIDELNQFVRKYFRLLSIDFSDDDFIQVKPSIELEMGQVKIQHFWEESYQPEIVISNYSNLNRSKETAGYDEKTIVTSKVFNCEDNETETVIRKSFKKLFCLDIWYKGNFQSSLPIFQPEVSFGRGSLTNKIDIVLKDDLRISRHHALLSYQNNNSFIFSVTGQNPAIVGSTPIFQGQTAAFNLGDSFQIGNYKLKTQV